MVTLNHFIPMHLTKLLHCQPTSLLVLHVTHKSSSKKRLKYAVKSTHGQAHSTLRNSPTNLQKKLGLSLKRLRNLEVWQPLSKQVFLRCVLKRLQHAHKHVSTQVYKLLLVSTNIVWIMKTLLISLKLITQRYVKTKLHVLTTLEHTVMKLPLKRHLLKSPLALKTLTKDVNQKTTFLTLPLKQQQYVQHLEKFQTLANAS